MIDRSETGDSYRPRIDVSIVTWNSDAFVDKCLRGVADQEDVDCEVVVVDNASTDGTIRSLQQWSDFIKLIQLPMNSGYSHAHNIAVQGSSAPYIACLNPDVFLEEDYLSRIVRFLDCNPRFGGAIGKIEQSKDFSKLEESATRTGCIDTMGLEIRRSRHFVARRFGLPDTGLEVAPEEVFGVDGMAPVYRRTMLEEIAVGSEYFDEDFFAYCEDQDLSWRARLCGWRFACVPTSVAHHVRTWKPSKITARRVISPIQRRHAIRNHYWMIIKNDSPALACLHLPFILSRLLLIIAYSALFERHSLLAFVDIFRKMPQIAKKRRLIMSRRTVGAKEMKRWFGGFGS